MRGLGREHAGTTASKVFRRQTATQRAVDLHHLQASRGRPRSRGCRAQWRHRWRAAVVAVVNDGVSHPAEASCPPAVCADHGFQRLHGFGLQKYGLILSPLFTGAVFETVVTTCCGGYVRWAAVVGQCGGRFSRPTAGVVRCLFIVLDSYEEREDRVRWLRWYLGMSLALGNLPGGDVGLVKVKNISAHRG